jgi:hypothetical protein
MEKPSKTPRRSPRKKATPAESSINQDDEAVPHRRSTRFHPPTPAAVPKISKPSNSASKPSIPPKKSGRRGRPKGDGIAPGRRTEEYKEQIELGSCSHYEFPPASAGKPPKKGATETEGQRKRKENVREVANYIIDDMYEHLTDGLIIPENAPVDFSGMCIFK